MQADVEVQLTEARDWGEPTTAAPFQTEAGVPVSWPVRIESPASGNPATEVPTATHEPGAVHDTPVNEAAKPLTVSLVQEPPPFALVRTTPWPERTASRVELVVPTTTQSTPAGDDVVGPRHETPLRNPVPAGTEDGAHWAPPSVVTATVPATWSRSGMVRAVTQQCWSSVQEIPVAPDIPGGRAPSWFQVAPAAFETRTDAPSALVASATHRPFATQETAVTSPAPAGTASGTQAVPPLAVATIAPTPEPAGPDCPTATQCRWSMQETLERKPTVGGTTAAVQDAPPVEEVTMPAPLGVPSTPTVEPTATHRVALGQLTAPRELTGGGNATGTKPPCQGESAATVEGAEADPEGGLDVQAPAATVRTADAASARRAPRERRRECGVDTPGYVRVLTVNESG